jgi:hypothetical protein
LHINKRCQFSVGGFCKFLHFHVLFYYTTWTCINNFSKLITLIGFLGCLQEIERHTIDWAKLYITKFLEARIRKYKVTMNLTIPQRWWSNMLNLHAINKEMWPLNLHQKVEDQHFNWIEPLQYAREVCGQMKHCNQQQILLKGDIPSKDD